MTRNIKAQPQSWESAYHWLSSLTAKDDRPVLETILTRDGRAYACDGFVLGSAACPLPLPWGTLLSREGKDEPTPVLTTSHSAYPDVEKILLRDYADQIKVNTAELVRGLNRVAVLCNGARDSLTQSKMALAVHHRTTQTLWLYAEDGRGAAVSVCLGVDWQLSRYDPAEVGSGTWFNPDLWLKALRGWTKNPGGWPDRGGCDQTLIQFAVPRRDAWWSHMVQLSPFPDLPRLDKPFVLVMCDVTGNGILLASLAYQKASSGQTDSSFSVPYQKRQYPRNRYFLPDAPLLDGVPPLKLTGDGPSPIQWTGKKIEEALDQDRRNRHFTAMRNAPSMIPYSSSWVASGEGIDPFIKAVKESQNVNHQ